MRALMVVVLLLSSGCGVKMGQDVVFGTTGFLNEVNRGVKKAVVAVAPSEQVARRDER